MAQSRMLENWEPSGMPEDNRQAPDPDLLLTKRPVPDWV